MQQECINQMLVTNNYRPPEVGGAIAKRVERDGSVRFASWRKRTEIESAAHAGWMRGGSRMLDEDGGAGLGGRFPVGSGAPTAGETGICVAGWGVEDMGAKTPGGGAGQAPKPRSGAALLAGLYARRQSR
jgi:hypothetical protein